MRRVGGSKPGTTEIYVPKAHGNREDPEPVRVHYLVPTEAQRRALKRAEGGGRFAIDPKTGQADRDEQGRIRVQLATADETSKRKRAIEDHVVSIENYVGADGEPIDTAGRFWTHGEPEIVDEVADEILASHGMREDEKKSSVAPSG